MLIRRKSSLSGAPSARRLRRRPVAKGLGWRERVIWGLGLLLVVGGLVYLLRSVFAILGTSVVFAYLLDPIVDRWEARGRSRETGIGVIFGTFALVLAMLIFVVLPSVSQEFIELSGNVSTYLDQLGTELVALRVKAEELLGRPIPVQPEDILAELQGSETVVGDAAPNVGKWVAGFLSTTLSGGIAFVLNVLNLALLPIFTFYLLRDWDRIIEGIDSMVPVRFQERTRRLAGEIDQRLGSFVRGQITVCLALAVLYSVGLLISGIDMAIVVGVTAGLLFIVPYLGTVVGIVLASALALLKFGFDWHILAVWATFGIAQAIEGFLLTPYIVGDKVGLHPFVVMLALIVGGNLFGIWGMLFAIPVTAAALVLLNEWVRGYRASRFYGT
jgi:predicted PurR-regulated permease PerM